MSTTSDNQQYSRVRDGLRIVVPVFAVLLIAGMLIFPNLDSDDTGFTLSFENAVSEDGVVQMINPKFVGTDKLGRPYTVSASRAVQERQKEGQTRLSDIAADITLTDGVWVNLSAATGELRGDSDELRLLGPIQIFTDIGYEFQASDLRVFLKDGTAETTSKVTGQGPGGTIMANSMNVARNGEWIKFGNGVRIVIYPSEVIGSDGTGENR